MTFHKIFPAGRAYSRALRIPFEIINFFRGGPEVKQFVIFLKTFVRRKRKLENDFLSASRGSTRSRDGFSYFTKKKCINILLLNSIFKPDLHLYILKRKLAVKIVPIIVIFNCHETGSSSRLLYFFGG